RSASFISQLATASPPARPLPSAASAREREGGHSRRPPVRPPHRRPPRQRNPLAAAGERVVVVSVPGTSQPAVLDRALAKRAALMRASVRETSQALQRSLLTRSWTSPARLPRCQALSRTWTVEVDVMGRDALREYVRGSLWVLPTLSVLAALAAGA